MTIPDEVIISKIYLIRGRRVMIDRENGVETRVLKQDKEHYTWRLRASDKSM